MVSTGGSEFLPYLPRISRDWMLEPDRTHQQLDASLVFVDLSGFTGLTERLATRGRRGAEEVSGIIANLFAAMLVPAYGAGGSLLKFGGDALLLMFDGADHRAAAAHATVGMRSELRRRSTVSTSVGRIRLGMTSAVASGTVHLFMVGADSRELILGGRVVSEVLDLERRAQPGQTVISPSVADALRPSDVATAADGTLLLARRPPIDGVPDVTEAPDAAVDLAFVPAAVQHRLSSGFTSPEHRRIAVGFVGISGLDALTESDPAGAAEVLSSIIGTAQHSAEEHGAWLLSSDIAPDGAKLIITAGAPVATGHDEAALLLTLSDLMEVDTPLGLRLGANHGSVFFGDIGPDYRKTLTVMGDVVNTAARLMSVATERAIAAPSSMLSARHVRMRSGGTRIVELRGRAEPVEVSDIFGPSSSEQAISTGNLIGRDSETAALERALVETTSSGTQLVEVWGPPGSGRSALVEAFTASVSNRFPVVRLAASMTDRRQPFGLVKRILAASTGVDPGSPGAHAQLHRAVAEASPQLVDDLPFIVAPLGLEDLGATSESAVGDEFRPLIIRRTLAGILEALGPPSMLLTIDDAHLADAASIDVLRHLTDAGDNLAWLIVVTGPTSGVVGAEGSVHSIGLAPLDTDAMRSLAIALTESAPLAGHELDDIVLRAAGNPSVMREMLAARQHSPAMAHLPAEAEALAALRLDNMPRVRQRQLEIASVLGPVFDPELFALLDDDPHSDITEWDDGQLQRDDEGRIRFTNVLLRDVAYNRIPFQMKTSLHDRIADAVGNDGTSIDQRAFHLYRAERWSEAYEASLAAADAARTAHANVEARSWYESALDSARKAGIDRRDLVDLHVRIGETSQRLGAFSEAADWFKRAFSASDDPSTRASLLIRRARVYEKLGSYRQALGMLTRAQRMADGDPEVHAAVGALRAGIRFYQGRHREAATIASRTVSMAGSTAAAWRALALMVSDMAAMAEGRTIDGTASEEALALFERLGDLAGQARVTNNLGMAAFYAGDWERARELYDRSRETFTRIGDEVNASYGAANVAEILAAQGWFPEAEELFRDVRRVWRAADDRYGIAYIEGQLGTIAARLGRHDDALGRLQHAEAEFEAIGATAEITDVACHRVETHLLAGHTNDALALIDRYGLLDVESGTSTRVSMLAAVAAWQQGTTTSGDISDAAERARAAGDPVAELRLLELHARVAGPEPTKTRRSQLERRLGLVASPVYGRQPVRPVS